MEDLTTVFDQCQTLDEIHAQLQSLIQELLVVAHRQDADHVRDAGRRSGPSPQTPQNSLRGTSGTIALNILSELSYADLKHAARPVWLVSEICRLLFKSGDRQSLKYALALSHTIYTFQCTHHESWYIAHLYKGIAQIGLRWKDLGVKNVVTGLSEPSGFSVVPVDRALGYWALIRAAIGNKNLKLAVSFAEQWHDAALDDNLAGELVRSNIVQTLFHLLYHDKERATQTMQKLLKSHPMSWKRMVEWLHTWLRALPQTDDIVEPYPLLLGMSWHHPSPVDDFRLLCETSRTLSVPDVIHSLSADELEQYAHRMAQWELPRSLHALECALKHCESERYFCSRLTRLLGRSVREKTLSKHIRDQELTTPNNAIILVLDVRRFSSLSENRTPAEIFELLNPVFKIMSEELEPVGGTVLEFVGDSIIVVFNTFAGQSAAIADILRHTVNSLQRIYVLNALSLQTTRPDIRIGVGIHTGPVALGYLGGLQRCHLTVLGNTVNVAARLESASKELSGDVIVSAACFEQPLPEVWREPWTVNFSLRDLGLYGEMKNISTPLRLFGISPLLRYWVDFVPMGFVAYPEKGVVYLDTGNSDEPGIIDHHFERQQADSACELLLRKPELLVEHIKDAPRSQIEFRVHTLPDLDCAASLYTAQELLDIRPRQSILEKLATYVSSIDQARIPNPENISDSLYGVFQAHRLLTQRKYGNTLTDRVLLEAELRVIDAAVYLLEQQEHEGDFSSIFRFQSEWFAEEKRLIHDDLAHYQEDIRLRGHTYAARVNGIPEPVTGLWLDHPHSIFYRIWAWNAAGGQQYRFLALDLSQPGKNRFMIGVDPATGTDVRGLGQLLEQHESAKRQTLGKERPVYPIRYPSDNSDPWYFGQGHNYAVVDSPGQGTVLTAEEVQKIHESW